MSILWVIKIYYLAVIHQFLLDYLHCTANLYLYYYVCPTHSSCVSTGSHQTNWRLHNIFLTMWAVVCHKRIYNLRFSSEKLPHTGKESNIAFTCRQVTRLPSTISTNSLSQTLESVTFKSAGPALHVMKTFSPWPPHWQDIYPTQVQVKWTWLLKK